MLGLQLNAAAIICVHNHPSGVCVPSRADENITRRIKEACRLLDIRVQKLKGAVTSKNHSVS